MSKISSSVILALVTKVTLSIYLSLTSLSFSLPSPMPSNQNHALDEFQWLIRIRRVLEEEFDGDDEYPISITTVPKPLLCSKPENYIPQYIAIGPYHHHREELHDMERYKLSAAKRTQNQLSNLKFQNLVDLIAKLEHRIRAHYYR